MQQPCRILLLFTISAFVVPEYALAYIGPGAGLSALGTVVALIGAFLLMIVGFVWYPIKRLLRGRQKAAATDNAKPADPAPTSAEPTNPEPTKAEPTKAERTDAKQ